MKSYIFGYGSLVNIDSAAKTLGRIINDNQVLIVDAIDFSRLWRLVTKVIVNGKQGEDVNAVFLDIAYQRGKESNGIVFEVSIDELKKLDIREQYYRRIDITKYIRPHIQDGKVYTYQGKPEFFAENFTSPVVLAQYLKMIDEGIRRWGKSFSDKFKATTQPLNFTIINGTYKFYNEEQNILTGRDQFHRGRKRNDTIERY